ncbi:hypothetical protein H5410_004511 [Solanum commersonii]|uniref:Uncharacterized protein n=1 Tax=Solanum commersonii TaxID=4109 RepID=A0A9J6B878_SOLCO|nr:hypothetical protein H5410_004511 [Solanum commersonii]
MDQHNEDIPQERKENFRLCHPKVETVGMRSREGVNQIEAVGRKYFRKYGVNSDKKMFEDNLNYTEGNKADHMGKYS